MHHPTCSVVICTRNRLMELERCLQAVRRLRYPDFQVVVVDNAPADHRARELARGYAARYVVDPVPGLSHARNAAARLSETEVLAYLDDDAVPDKDWLNAIAMEFEDPQVMAVVGRCLPLKVDTEAERLWARACEGAVGPNERRVLARTDPDWFECANFGGLGNGMNMAFRRAAFDLWPGFDERLGRGMPLDGGEEHLAFFSLVQGGYKLVATPAAVVCHPCPETMDALRLRRLKDRAAAVGYLSLLLVEEKGYRFRTLRYICRKVCGRVPAWGQSKLPRSLVPGWQLFLAQLKGPWLYLLSSLKARRSRTAHLQRLRHGFEDHVLCRPDARREARGDR